jgi:hypothetical protein
VNMYPVTAFGPSPFRPNRLCGQAVAFTNPCSKFLIGSPLRIVGSVDFNGEGRAPGKRIVKPCREPTLRLRVIDPLANILPRRDKR